MQNDRARARGERHPPPEPLELTSWEDIRALYPVDEPRLSAAYERLADAEQMLYQRWEEQHGDADIDRDPVGMLLGHPIMPENGDESLWLLGLGEKVAALGGHLEVQAIFPAERLTLIIEPASDGQPPLIDRVMDLAAPRTPAEREPLPDGQVDVDLTPDERAFLISGLAQWSRAAPPSEPLVKTMGFTSLEDFPEEQLRLAYSLRYATPLPPADWERVLTATEIGLATNYFGAGEDWQARTGRDDQPSFQLLRHLQQKLAPVIGRTTPPAQSQDTPSQ